MVYALELLTMLGDFELSFHYQFKTYLTTITREHLNHFYGHNNDD
jgi:hypothetical protein